MKIQDVRINSIYQIAGIPVRVLNWYNDKKVTIQFLVDRNPDTEIVYYQELEGVKFNEEWQTKLGIFRKDGVSDEAYDFMMRGQVKLTLRSKDSQVEIKFPEHPKYVHKLQNIYWAATGNELGE
jgi:hypothetical protein